jgi:D-beta-D-heptose 7-phosphate kinase/D-beta-D-heptose 1-phosphate adenosyltransferase
MRKKIVSWNALKQRLASLRRAGKRIVFTNGCFELIHLGHVRYLEAAKRLGDVLIVGLNTDRSIRRLAKGPERPLNPEQSRAEVLAALEMVDFVTLFDQDTPLDLIRIVRPDVLVKGGDWRPDRIVGADFVRSYRGTVRALPYVKGYSTTKLLQRARCRTELPSGAVAKSLP